jgi:hypothetical protein
MNLITVTIIPLNHAKNSGIEPLAIGLSYELLQETIKRPSIIYLHNQPSLTWPVSHFPPVLCSTFLVIEQQPIKEQTVLGISSGVFGWF